MKKNVKEKPNDYERFMFKMFIIRRAIIILLTAASVFVYFYHIRVPMLPQFFTVEFSSFFELLLTFAYGPFYGILACLIKNAVHIALLGNSLITDASNFICESVFLLVAGLCSPRLSDRAAVKKEGAVTTPMRFGIKVLSSLLAIIAQLAAQFAVTEFITYPLLVKYYPNAYSMPMLVSSYNTALNGIRAHLPQALGRMLPEVKNVWQGILMINLPVTFAKLVAVSALTLLVYFLIFPLIFPKGPSKHNTDNNIPK